MKTREKAEAIVNDGTFYVEARVGSNNYRNYDGQEPCRAVFRGARSNEPADKLIRELARDYLELYDAAFNAFSALVGAMASDDSVQGKARIRLRVALGIPSPSKEESGR